MERFRIAEKYRGTPTPRQSGDKMREGLKIAGVDPDCGDPLVVFASFKTWSLEDFRHPLKRMAATNLIRQFLISTLCPPNDMRGCPDLPREKAAWRLIQSLQEFIRLCAEWQHRIEAVKDPSTTREAKLWFEKTHLALIRDFRFYLERQDLAR